MKPTHPCPECRGSGCAAKPLQAPDGSVFLFPRCDLCKGKGSLSEEQWAQYTKRRDA